MSLEDAVPSTPGKLKHEKPSNFYLLHHHHHHRTSSLRRSFFKLTLYCLLFALLFLLLFLLSPPSPLSRRHLSSSSSSSLPGGPLWSKRVVKSSRPKPHSSTTVLVTGAAGFVGSHLSLALKRRGDGVLGLDNFNPYYDVALKRHRQNKLKESDIFIVEGDLNDAALLAKLFDVVLFTHVAHLAAQAGVRHATRDPYSYVNSNVAGFVNLLEACKKANPQPAIIWASSSSVYGLNPKIPFSEKDRTDQPASLYAATKKSGEMIAHVYNHIYGLSITGLRFFTVYGPMGRPDMAYYSFTKDILRGREISIYETAHGRSVARDFTYIDDVVKGFLAAVDTARKSTGSGGKRRGAAQLRVYNLGNQKPVTVGEMVRVLEKVLKVKAKKRVVELPRNGDVESTHANVSLAERELGFRPSTDLETGLKKFVKWYLSYSGKKKGGSSGFASSW